MSMILGVVGAGTMGAGIAQLGCAAGVRTLLHDLLPDALAAGGRRVHDGLGRWAKKGRVDAAAAERLELAPELDGLGACDIVIEAAPERLPLKRELFERLSEICGPDAVLATNTSSIPVTAIAGAAARPENVVGMHFFNPPPLMPLVELIRAEQTGDGALERARETVAAMGKEAILVADGPGFLVNRAGRPFYAEALRLVQERVAAPDAIDRICRLGGGYPMGPFELMDLVGIDVGLEVSESFAALSFGEPRWRPSPIQALKVASGQLGRKTGRGYYKYENGPYRPDDPEPPPPRGGHGTALAILGSGPLADGLRERARGAGYELREGAPAELVVDAGPRPEERLPGGAPLALLCASGSLAARGEPAAVGFHLLPPVDGCRLVELTRLESTPEFAARAVEDLFGKLGFLVEWVEDAPGLVLGRIAAQLVNEAWFAVGEGVAAPADVDMGLKLGLSHPRGPIEWCEAIGTEHVMALLDGLWRERREERYRPAPLLLRRAMLAGWRPPT